MKLLQLGYEGLVCLLNHWKGYSWSHKFPKAPTVDCRPMDIPFVTHSTNQACQWNTHQLRILCAGWMMNHKQQHTPACIYAAVGGVPGQEHPVK